MVEGGGQTEDKCVVHVWFSFLKYIFLILFRFISQAALWYDLVTYSCLIVLYYFYKVKIEERQKIGRHFDRNFVRFPQKP